MQIIKKGDFIIMKSSEDLRIKLRSIDHRGYPAYKDLKGQYDFRDYTLSIDHVQGDPFASPSRLSIHIPAARAGFPPALYDTCAKRITLQDHLTRLFAARLASAETKGRGSGKSGLLAVSRCGQEVLERTACRIQGGNVILRFEAGFPARGRTIDAGELEKMLFGMSRPPSTSAKTRNISGNSFRNWASALSWRTAPSCPDRAAYQTVP